MDKAFPEVPDFSGDDFKDDKEILIARKQAEAYQKMINDSLSILESNLSLTESSHKNFKSFKMFKGLQATIADSYLATIYSSKLIVSIAEYSSSYPTARDANSGTEKYLFGYMELTRYFPSTYICKESMQQKIINLFSQSDIDFREYRKFSRKFNVVTEDSKKLADLFSLKPVNDLLAFSDMEVEIHDRACLFRNSRRAISPKEATEFSSLTKTLYRLLN